MSEILVKPPNPRKAAPTDTKRPAAPCKTAAPAKGKPAAKRKAAAKAGFDIRNRPYPFWVVIIADVLLIGISLVLFSLPHHVVSRTGKSTGVVIERPDAAPQEAEQVETQVAAVNTGGSFYSLYPDKFSTGGVQEGQTPDGKLTYVSENVNITRWSAVEDFHNGNGEITYHVFDIYVRDISNLTTAFAKDTYGKGIKQYVADMANAHGAIAALSGDYYGIRDDGLVLRNGELYRDNIWKDIGVLYWDGTFETYEMNTYTLEDLLARKPYQIWSFGPELLTKNGKSKLEFNSGVATYNPRALFGYYAPGHYCFVTVDGRLENSIGGTTLEESSLLMYKLGCVQAYNLDGGGSVEMLWKGERFNVQTNNGGRGRTQSDCILIVE